MYRFELTIRARPAYSRAQPACSNATHRGATWLYDPANKDEILAITRKTMEVSAVPAENTYKLHIAQNVVAHNLRINEVPCSSSSSVPERLAGKTCRVTQ